MLKQSGIELVAKNYNQFFRQIDQLEKSYKKLTDTQRALSKTADPLERSTSNLARNYKKLEQEAEKLQKTQKDLQKSSKEAGDSLKNTAQGADQSVDSIKSLRDRIKELRTNLEQLDRSDPNFDKQTRELQQLRAELNDYTRSIRATKRATDTAEDSYEALREELNSLRQSYRRLSEAERDGIAGRNTLARISSLDTKLKGIDNSMGQFQRNVGNYGSAVTGLVNELGILSIAGPAAFVAVGTAAVNFGKDSLKEFESFQTGIREVFTLLPNLGAQGLQELEAEALNFSASVGRVTDETIPALYQALSAGVPQENVFDFLKIASNAAQGGVTDLETSVDTLTSVVNAYGEQNISVSEASDILFTTVRLGKTTFAELGASISGVTPIAKAAGISFDQVGAFLANVTAQGTGTSEAVTQLKALIGELVQPTSRLAKFFQELSGQSFKEFAAEGGTLFEALNLIEQGAADAGTEIEALFGSKEATLAFLQVTGDQAANVAENLRDMAEATGATNEAAAQFEDTLARRQSVLDAEIERLKILTGQALLPAKEAYVEFGIAAAQAISDISQNSGTFRERIEDINRLILFTQGSSGSTIFEKFKNGLTLFNLESEATRIQAEEAAAAVEDLGDDSARAAEDVNTLAESNADLADTTAAVTEAIEAEAEAVETLGQRRERERQQLEESISLEAIREASSRRAADATQRRNELIAEAAQAVADENISREKAIEIVTEEIGNRDRATRAIDAQVEAINESKSAVVIASEEQAAAIEEAAKADELAAEKRALLIERTRELVEELGKLTDAGFNQATSIINDIVEADDAESFQAATAALVENRNKAISDLLRAQTQDFEQEISIQLAFGQITVEEAELQRLEKQFFDAVDNVFGGGGVINIGDRVVSVGQLIIENDGADAAAQITEQIKTLIDQGDGAEVDLTTRIIPKLAEDGNIDTSQITEVTQRALDEISQGATAVEAVELAIQPIVDTEQPIADIQAIANEINGVTEEENSIEFTNNSDEMVTDIDEMETRINEVDALEPDIEFTNNKAETIEDLDSVEGRVNDVDALEPDITISSNASEAESEIRAVRDAVLAVPTTRNINFNVTQTGSAPDAPGFMQGGFTGYGPRDRVAGVVHAGEVVIPADVLSSGLMQSVQFLLNAAPHFSSLPASLASRGDIVNQTRIDNSRHVEVNANYHRTQSPATIRDDLALFDF